MSHPSRRTAAKALLSLTLVLGAGWASAQSFNMITPAELKKRLESGDKPMLLDIQVGVDLEFQGMRAGRYFGRLPRAAERGGEHGREAHAGQRRSQPFGLGAPGSGQGDVGPPLHQPRGIPGGDAMADQVDRDTRAMVGHTDRDFSAGGARNQCARAIFRRPGSAGTGSRRQAPAVRAPDARVWRARGAPANIRPVGGGVPRPDPR